MSALSFAHGLPESDAQPRPFSQETLDFLNDCFSDQELREGALVLIAILQGSGDSLTVLRASVGGQHIFSQVLRHELAYACAHRPELVGEFAAAGQGIASLEEQLEERYGTPGADPPGRDAPLQLQVQGRLVATPHWVRLGPVFLRSLAAKETQLRGTGSLDEEMIRARLKGFLGYPLIIAERLPEGALPPAPARLASHAGRPVAVVLAAVHDYVRERGLARSTRRTILQRWAAACDVAPIETPYRQRGASALHRLKARYRAAQQSDQEQEPQDPEEQSASPRAKGRSHLPAYYLAGVAPRALTPSRFSQNGLPLSLLARLTALVARRPVVEQQTLHLLLQLGRTTQWICAFPARSWHPAEGCLSMGNEAPFNWPERYIAMAGRDPEDLRFRAFWEVHAEVYEPVGREVALPVPPELFDKGSGPGSTFLVTEAGEANSPKDLRRYLRGWTEMLTRADVSAPAITVGRLHSSFDGLYSDAGLSPEERFLVSGRRPAGYTLSCWYHSLAQGELLEHYATAYAQVCSWLAACEGVELPTHPLNGLQPKRAHGFLGHPRRARADRVAQITDRAIRRYRQAEEGKAPLKTRYLRLVDLLVCGMLLCYGLRPFELGRLCARHLDLDTGWLVVDGKARPGEDAVRLLPLVQSFDRLFARLLALRRRLRLDRQPELLLVLAEDGPRPLNRQAVEEVLRGLNGERRHAPPEAYSWRVLHYGLACQVLELAERRYLMGHKTAGLGATNPYQPACLPGLRDGLEKLIAHIDSALGLTLAQLTEIHARP